MITNILATIITVLVTNTAEKIIQEDFTTTQTLPNLNALGFIYRPQDQWWTPKPPATKAVRTDVNEMRLLILEAEGLCFTNILSNVLKWRSDELFVREIPKVEPQWVLQPDSTRVQTNWPVGILFATNLFLRGEDIVATNKFDSSKP